MKKVLFVAVIALASVMAYAQPRAIGARFGGFEGVSYQHSLGENNMIEIELGFGMGGNVNGSLTGKWSEFYDHNYYHYRYIDDKYNYSFTGNVIEAAFTYDWINPFDKTIPWDKKGKWNWYLGVGAAGGYGWKAYTKINAVYDENFLLDPVEYNVGGSNKMNWGFVGVAGRAGVEYEFWFPLVVSVDYRPVIGAGIGENPLSRWGNWNDADEKKLFGTTLMAGCYWDVFNVAISARYKF